MKNYGIACYKLYWTSAKSELAEISEPSLRYPPLPARARLNTYHFVFLIPTELQVFLKSLNTYGAGVLMIDDRVIFS